MPATLLICSVYALLDVDAVRAPGGRVGMAGRTLARVRRVVPLPEDDELPVQTDAALQVACGAIPAAGVLGHDAPATRGSVVAVEPAALSRSRA